MRIRKSMFGFAGAIWLYLTAAGLCGMFTVVNSDDSGPGSLRQAMTDAEYQVGPDTLVFQIPVTDAGYNPAEGTWTIRPLAQMRNLVWEDGTMIDGNTQAAFITGDPNPRGPEIVIDGSLAGEVDGFSIYSRRNSLTGLVIYGFKYSQVNISGDSNRVSGCYIGLDASGGRRGSGGNTGITISPGSWNVIGGESPVERNVISGNRYNGIHVSGFSLGGSNNNQFIGNFIGIRADGSDTLGNGGDGLSLTSRCRYNEIGPGNVISGNQRNGISINEDSTAHNSIKGNLIGTDPSGKLAWGNYIGIILSNSSGNVIGGNLPNESNTVSGNLYDGIDIMNSASVSNDIIGNRIGVDVTGDNPLGNGEQGVRIENGANRNRIGDGTLEGANVISGNGRNGIMVFQNGTNGNRVEGNFIGTGAGGIVPVGNGWSGIQIFEGAMNTVVGPGNVIADNASYGILIQGENTVGHTVTRNSIDHNQEMGIATFSGGNLELASPILAGLNPVSGTAVPNGKVEIFSDNMDEGRIYEGFTTADGSGNFSWAGSCAGPNVTATVTDENGNTSEFSAPVQLTGIEQNGNTVPKTFSLSRNYPNPFNPVTTIRFGVKYPCQVTLKVLDLLGREVANVADAQYNAGRHSVQFNASRLPSGIYVYTITMGNFTTSRKMAVMK